MFKFEYGILSAAAITALVSFGPTAQAATCPSPIISGAGYVTVSPTTGSPSCVAYGTTVHSSDPIINDGSDDPIIALGYHYITGLNGSGTFGQVTLTESPSGSGTGTFTVNSGPDSGYS